MFGASKFRIFKFSCCWKHIVIRIPLNLHTTNLVGKKLLVFHCGEITEEGKLMVAYQSTALKKNTAFFNIKLHSCFI